MSNQYEEYEDIEDLVDLLVKGFPCFRCGEPATVLRFRVALCDAHKTEPEVAVMAEVPDDEVRHWAGDEDVWTTCPRCRGNRNLWDATCKECGMEGWKRSGDSDE